MRALSLLCLLACTSPPLLAADLDGHYQGTLDERPVQLVLRSQGQQVEGEYIEDQQRFHLSGHFDGQALQAQISATDSDQVLANMNANYANDMLAASLAARDPQSGQTLLRETLFQRVATVPPQANPRQDPALVGTWVFEQMSNSEGMEYASLTTVTTLRIRADGSIEQWRRSVAGGSEWSYDRPGELQYSGRWRSEQGLLLVQLKGATEFQPAARYRFDTPYLVTESNTGRMIWQRR
ncbi:hypothetical protein SAMN05878276_3690 [Aquipseudomonas alcaligenes]|uniref:hypothetical protein n=1 Tax=Aquipseudomonas alcaligenes TaxID=43263 RepID=UPI000953B5D5|nr:hypothetical protein [Pseudomonas alcaligenes]SIS23084.1 hypothetical protein SAMN05878276_3690 [Pseudomonas alcaligenes]